MIFDEWLNEWNVLKWMNEWMTEWMKWLRKCNNIIIPSGVWPAQFKECRFKDERLQGWRVKVYQGWYNLEDFGDTFVQIDQGSCILCDFGPKSVQNVWHIIWNIQNISKSVWNIYIYICIYIYIYIYMYMGGWPAMPAWPGPGRPSRANPNSFPPLPSKRSHHPQTIPSPAPKPFRPLRLLELVRLLG